MAAIKRDMGISHTEGERDASIEKAEALAAREQLRNRGTDHGNANMVSD